MVVVTASSLRNLECSVVSNLLFLRVFSSLSKVPSLSALALVLGGFYRNMLYLRLFRLFNFSKVQIAAK